MTAGRAGAIPVYAGMQDASAVHKELPRVDQRQAPLPGSFCHWAGTGVGQQFHQDIHSLGLLKSGSQPLSCGGQPGPWPAHQFSLTHLGGLWEGLLDCNCSTAVAAASLAIQDLVYLEAAIFNDTMLLSTRDLMDCCAERKGHG